MYGDSATQNYQSKYSKGQIHIQPNGHMASDEHISAMISLQNFMSRFSYKPKWAFEFHEHSASIHRGFDSALLMIPLTILFPVVHCYGEKKGLEERLNVRVSFRMIKMTPGHFLEEMLKHIKMIEEHEMKEWLKFDNVRFEVPHLPDQPTVINPLPLGDGVSKMKFNEMKEEQENTVNSKISITQLRASVNRTATMG